MSSVPRVLCPPCPQSLVSSVRRVLCPPVCSVPRALCPQAVGCTHPGTEGRALIPLPKAAEGRAGGWPKGSRRAARGSPWDCRRSPQGGDRTPAWGRGVSERGPRCRRLLPRGCSGSCSLPQPGARSLRSAAQVGASRLCPRSGVRALSPRWGSGGGRCRGRGCGESRSRTHRACCTMLKPRGLPSSFPSALLAAGLSGSSFVPLRPELRVMSPGLCHRPVPAPRRSSARAVQRWGDKLSVSPWRQPSPARVPQECLRGVTAVPRSAEPAAARAAPSPPSASRSPRPCGPRRCLRAQLALALFRVCLHLSGLGRARPRLGLGLPQECPLCPASPGSAAERSG